MSHNKNLLLIGGPGDGLRFVVPATQRIFYLNSNGTPDNDDNAGGKEPDYTKQPNADITAYALGTVQGAFHEVFHVGVTDLSKCAICALVAGYRKPQQHDSDLNVAKQLVTLLGGAADGRQIVLGSLTNFVSANEMGDAYQIVPLICKDGNEIRVGILDVMSVDPIKLLIEGYRMGVQQ